MPPLEILTEAVAASGSFLLLYTAWSAGSFVALRTVPRHLHRSVLLALSLLFLALFFSPATTAFFIGSTFLLWAIQSPPEWFTRFPVLSSWHRNPAPALLFFLAVVYVPLLLSGVLFDWGPHNPAPEDIVAVTTAAIWFKKAVSFSWQRHHKRFEAASPLPIFLYFLSLPFLLGRSLVVSFTHFFEREQVEDHPVRLRSAARTMGWVLLHIGILVGLYLALPLHWNIRRYPSSFLLSLDPVDTLAILGVHWFAFYAWRYALEQWMVASARLLGYAIDDNVHQVLLATGYADFWRRWNIHFRDFLAASCFYPTAMAILRRHPTRRPLAIVVASMVIFLAHGLLDWVHLAAFVPPANVNARLGLGLGLFIYESAQVVLVASSLLVGNPFRDRFPRFGPALGVVTTFVLRAILVLFLVRRSGDALALLVGVSLLLLGRSR